MDGPTGATVRKYWLNALGLLLAGVIIGAGGIVASTEINRLTGTDAFCVSCHSMTQVAADPHFQQSRHEANAAGIRVGCADCHIPPGNWFTETYAHAASGIRDVFAEVTHNYGDAEKWAQRVPALAAEVRDEMRRQDSATCRKCHDAAAVRPSSQAGRAAHAMLQQKPMSCIDCHFNITHAPIAPSAAFLRGSGLGSKP